MLTNKNNRDLTNQLLDEFHDEEAQIIETAIWDLGRKSLEGEKKAKRGFNLENWQVRKSKGDSKSRSPKLKSKASKKKDMFKIKKTMNTSRCRYENVFPYYNPYAAAKSLMKKSQSLNKITPDRALAKDPTPIIFDADILNGKNYLNSFRTKPLNKLTIRLEKKSKNSKKSKKSILNKRLKKITNFSKDLDLKFGKLTKMKLEPRYKRKKFYGMKRKESATFNGLKKQLMKTIRGKSTQRKRPSTRQSNKKTEQRRSKIKIRIVDPCSPTQSERYFETIYSKNSKEKYTFKHLDKSVKILIREKDVKQMTKEQENLSKSVFKKSVKNFIKENDMRIQFNIGKIREKIVREAQNKTRDKEIDNFIVKRNYTNGFRHRKGSRVTPNTTSIKSLL